VSDRTELLMYRVLFNRVPRIAYGEHCYTLLTLFIVYHPRTSLGTKTGEYVYQRCIDFPIQTSGSYFSSSRANATGVIPRERDALFLRPRDWNVSQLRAISSITIGREMPKEERTCLRQREKERERERERGREQKGKVLAPSRARFRCKSSRKCNGSDLQGTRRAGRGRL